MSDVMSFTELGDQSVELLPARTVLSLMHAPTGAVIGAPGGQGTHGSAGPSLVSETWAFVLGYPGPSTGR
ncbi:MAG: hypothetical protein ACRDRX_15135 [Pseudonocardiaceae bacterium]